METTKLIISIIACISLFICLLSILMVVLYYFGRMPEKFGKWFIAMLASLITFISLSYTSLILFGPSNQWTY